MNADVSVEKIDVRGRVFSGDMEDRHRPLAWTP
jgi:hypothetical protein